MEYHNEDNGMNTTKEKLTLDSHEPKWFKEQGYLDIDLDVFGKGLSYLFTYNLDYPCFYNRVYYELEGKTEDGQTIRDGRHMAVIAPKQYAPHVKRPFEKTEFFQPRDRQDTMLKQQPLRLIDEAYLLSFSNEETQTMRLGDISGGKFIPSRLIPIRNISHIGEVEYNDPVYSFIQDFLKTIISYKIDTQKPTITLDDIYIILGQYGIKRREYLENLARVLKKAHDKAITTLSETNTVGTVLVKKSE